MQFWGNTSALSCPTEEPLQAREVVDTPGVSSTLPTGPDHSQRVLLATATLLPQTSMLYQAGLWWKLAELASNRINIECLFAELWKHWIMWLEQRIWMPLGRKKIPSVWVVFLFLIFKAPFLSFSTVQSLSKYWEQVDTRLCDCLQGQRGD